MCVCVQLEKATKVQLLTTLCFECFNCLCVRACLVPREAKRHWISLELKLQVAMSHRTTAET